MEFDSMPKTVRKVVDNFNLVVTTAKNIQATLVVAGIVVAGATLAVLKWEWPAWVTIPVAFLLGIGIGTALGVVTANRRSRDMITESGFEVIEYQMDYSIGENFRDHTCERTYRLRATHDDANLFYFDYNWSGRGRIATSVASPNHQVLAEGLSLGAVEKRAVIALGGPYSRGSEVSLIVKQELHDEAANFQHFLSKIIKGPMSRAALSINFPTNLGFEPRPEASLRRMNKRADWVREVDLTSKLRDLGNRRFMIEFDNPVPGKQLRVKWSWPGSY